MKMRNALLTLGAVASAAKIAKELTGVDLDDVFGSVGLTRRRSHVLENIALVGAGALAGAGAALLLAPKSGSETRRLIRQEVDRLGQAATEAMHTGTEASRTMMSGARGQESRSQEQKHSHA